jgi:hypothetical protein
MMILTTSSTPAAATMMVLTVGRLMTAVRGRAGRVDFIFNGERGGGGDTGKGDTVAVCVSER